MQSFLHQGFKRTKKEVMTAEKKYMKYEPADIITFDCNAHYIHTYMNHQKKPFYCLNYFRSMMPTAVPRQEIKAIS